MNRFLACLVAVSLIVAANASFARSSKNAKEAATEAEKEAVVAEKKAEKSKDAASTEHAAPVKKAKKKMKKACSHNKNDRYTYPGTFSTRAVEKR